MHRSNQIGGDRYNDFPKFSVALDQATTAAIELRVGRAAYGPSRSMFAQSFARRSETGFSSHMSWTSVRAVGRL